MRKKLTVATAFIVLCTVVAVGVTELGGASSRPATAQTAQPADNQAAGTAGPGSQKAPKKRIAVTKFDAIGSFVAQYGNWDVGAAWPLS